MRSSVSTIENLDFWHFLVVVSFYSLSAPSEYEFAHLEEKMNINHLNDLMMRFEVHFDEEISMNKVSVDQCNVTNFFNLQRCV